MIDNHNDHHPETLVHGAYANPMCLSSPLEVHLKITNRCNLQCWHCHSDAGPGSGAELSYDEIKSLCINLADWGVRELAVSGGEPFLREDCLDIIHAAVHTGLQVKINTNGTLLSNKVLAKLTNMGVRCLMISLDGATASVHNSIRGSEDSFDRTVRSVTESVQRGFEVMLRMTVSQMNQHQIADFVHLSEVLGVKTVGLTPVLQLGRAAHNYHTKGIALSKWEHIAAQAKTVAVGSSCRLVDTFAFFEFEAENDFPDGLAAYLVGCKAGKTLLSIDHQGSVWPCSLLHTPTTKLGNIRSKSIRDIWKDSAVLNQFRLASPTTLGEPCCNCTFVWQCMGGCRSYAMQMTGCPIAPDPRCPRTIN